jgi:hypothetical protein
LELLAHVTFLFLPPFLGMLFSKYISIGPNGKNAKKRKLWKREKRHRKRKKKESNTTHNQQTLKQERNR